MDSTRNLELTMADIARMAGVSESTVSRALAGSPLVAEKTRKRIIDLASAASYTVNEGARNLRQKKTRTIEVVIPIEAHHRVHISDPFFLDLIGALADALASRNYDMLLSKTPPWADDHRANSLISGRADGIIIIGQGRQRGDLRAFARQHRRVVVWGGVVDSGEYAVVGSNNRLGGELATAHLLGLGRKRIAFFGDISLPEIELRYAGYKDALAAATAPCDNSLQVDAPFDFQDAFVAANEFIRSGASFDAIVAASDVIAMSAISALRNHGVETPADVSVVGYDDIYSAAFYSPPLTTISQSIQRGGEALVEVLFDLMEGRPARDVVLEPKLVIRKSCGAD